MVRRWAPGREMSTIVSSSTPAGAMRLRMASGLTPRSSAPTANRISRSSSMLGSIFLMIDFGNCEHIPLFVQRQVMKQLDEQILTLVGFEHFLYFPLNLLTRQSFLPNRQTLFEAAIYHIGRGNGKSLRIPSHWLFSFTE